jgi:hypothetical protein
MAVGNVPVAVQLQEGTWEASWTSAEHLLQTVQGDRFFFVEADLSSVASRGSLLCGAAGAISCGGGSALLSLGRYIQGNRI